MTKTRENLRAAYAAACQETQRLRAYGRTAADERMAGIAALLDSAARGQEAVAARLLTSLGRLGKTRGNLQSALEEASYEADNMYPRALKQAESEGDPGARRDFHLAQGVSESMKTLLAQALQEIKAGRDIGPVDYHVCASCGRVTLAAGPGTVCSLCGDGTEPPSPALSAAAGRR